MDYCCTRWLYRATPIFAHSNAILCVQFAKEGEKIIFNSRWVFCECETFHCSSILGKTSLMQKKKKKKM